MEKEKAIQKALQQISKETLPHSLQNRIMKNIRIETAKRKRRVYIYNIILVSIVSLLLAIGSIYLIISRFNLSLTIPKFSFSPESEAIFASSVFIGSIILSLLILDSLLRKRYEHLRGK